MLSPRKHPDVQRKEQLYAKYVDNVRRKQGVPTYKELTSPPRPDQIPMAAEPHPAQIPPATLQGDGKKPLIIKYNKKTGQWQPQQ